MTQIPEKLQQTLDDFSLITTRFDRQDYLIQLADQFADVKVTPQVAEPPYDNRHRVQECESDAYVWSTQRDDGTLQYSFDVLNPQGLSAMAMSVVLGEACNGAPLEQVAAIPGSVVLDLFGKNISMGKGQGLIGIVNMVTTMARNQLAQQATSQ